MGLRPLKQEPNESNIEFGWRAFMTDIHDKMHGGYKPESETSSIESKQEKTGTFVNNIFNYPAGQQSQSTKYHFFSSFKIILITFVCAIVVAIGIQLVLNPEGLAEQFHRIFEAFRNFFRI